MITFVDEKGTEHSALVAYSVTNAVNGELSVKGTIYTNDKVLHGIGRGWRFRLDDEYYRITYAKPNDTGRQIEVEFDAVHQFFYDMSKSMVYTTLNGSKPFETYLQAIFSNSGYTYNLEATVGSIRKENFGNKSRLSLFNDIIKAAGLEFSVRGHVIRILKRVGTDLSTIVRKDFNMNELKIEKDINSFVTYQRGLGAWKDDEDHSKGRYETSYESPLSAIYGRIEADPIVDERYKDTGKLLERLKENVDKSYKVSVEIDMEDLSQAGYRISRPNPGDYIMAINETLGFRQKVRIVSFTSEYDVGGNLISRKVVCNDIGTVQRVTSEISHLSRTLTDSIEGSERALKTATKALVSADGKNTNYFGDVKPLDVPKGTLRKGDRLFLTVGDKKQLYFWNGAEWELEPTEFDHEKFDMEFNRNSQEIKKTIQENRQKAEEALRNAGASSLLAQEAKRIGLDSVAKLEEFKRQATSAQTALSGDLDILKRTIANDIRPKQVQVETEIAKQIEALTQTKNELAGVKSAQATYEETTTQRLAELTNLANGKASKSELTQTAEELSSKIASVQVAHRNQGDRVSAIESNFKQRADSLEAGVSRLTEGLRTKADISSLNVTAENIRQSVKSLETNTQDKLNQKLSLAEFEVRAGSIRQEILNATQDKADKTLVTTEAGKLREEFSNLRVGGRNLIRNYDWNGLLPLNIISSGWKFERVEDQFAKSGYMLKATCTKAGNGGFHKVFFDLRPNEFQGKDMTWSWDMKSSRPTTFYDMGFEAGGLKRNVPVSTEWTRITNTFKVALNRFYSCVFYANGWQVGDVVYIRDPQLEEGTIATSPKPAPEDTDGLITEAKAIFERTAQGLRTDLSAIQEYVNKDGQRQDTLQHYTREESARQANAVRELVSRDYVGKATHQEDVRGIERRLEAITNPQNGTIATQIANYKQSVDGRLTDITSLISGKASQVDFQQVQETSRLYERILGNTNNSIADNIARMALTNQLFQVEVGKVTRGGRNLIRNYDWNGLLPLQKLGTDWKFERLADKNAKSGYVLKATCTQGGAGGFYRHLFDLRSDEFQGKDMTSSWDMKASRSITFNVMGFEAGGLKRNVPVSTEWTRITNTFKVAFKELFSCVFYSFEWKVGDVVYIRDPQLEEGPIATSPKRALEDTDEAIRTVQSQLAGSWSVQNINSAGDLISGINLGANGHNRFVGKLTHITGETLIDNAVIKDGMIANLSADKVNFGTLNGNQVNIINLNAKSITSGTFRGLTFEGGIIRGLNGNTEINLNNNTTTYNGTASIVFKSPYNQLEFNSGGRKAFLAPTISTGTNYAAFAFGVNDRGNGDPNRDFVGIKIFNEPGSRVIEVVGDLIITNPDNQSTNTTSLKALFKAINDNFKMLKEFRIQYGEGSPGFYDVSLR